MIINYSFLDSEGTVLAQFDGQVIEPGKMMSFDLNADDIVRENNRIQIRVVLSGDRLTGLLTSTEVFENATGKTTVLSAIPAYDSELDLVKTILSISRRSILLAYLLILVSCSRHAFDPVMEQTRLLHQDAEWAELASVGRDVDKIVSYWSDDAVLIFPGQPVLEGKPAIRAYVEASLKTPGFQGPLGVRKAGILARWPARLPARH
jgi:hypothetical protein